MDTTVTGLNKIAGSITDHGTADPAKISNNQFTFFSSETAFPGIWVQDLGNEFTFVNVDGSGLTFKCESADLGGAGMIKAFCSPQFFNHFFGAGDTCPGLAGMDSDLNSGLSCQIDSCFFRFRSHM